MVTLSKKSLNTCWKGNRIQNYFIVNTIIYSNLLVVETALHIIDACHEAPAMFFTCFFFYFQVVKSHRFGRMCAKHRHVCAEEM